MLATNIGATSGKSDASAYVHVGAGGQLFESDREKESLASITCMECHHKVFTSLLFQQLKWMRKTIFKNREYWRTVSRHVCLSPWTSFAVISTHDPTRTSPQCGYFHGPVHLCPPAADPLLPSLSFKCSIHGAVSNTFNVPEEKQEQSNVPSWLHDTSNVSPEPCVSLTCCRLPEWENELCV